MTRPAQLTLLPECVLPGCRLPTDTVGHPCGDCVAVFAAQPGGWALVAREGPALTAEQIADRDATVAAAYADQVAARAGWEGDAGPQRRRNQTCWMCEQRRTCTQVTVGGQFRWECETCQEVR